MSKPCHAERRALSGTTPKVVTGQPIARKLKRLERSVEAGLRTNPGMRVFAIWDPSTRAPSPALPVDAAHAEVFDFEEFLDAVFRAFAADAAFLHAAEGGDLASGISAR
jgi:hypothetical protein